LGEAGEIGAAAAVGRDGPAAADGLDSDGFGFGFGRIEHVEEAAHFGELAAVAVEHGGTEDGIEVVVSGGDGEKLLLSWRQEAMAIFMGGEILR
jgi:hypothetical protein